ncbi:MAG: glycosyltransferase family 1 protein [Candidatus Woesebacteria bacterium]|nr:glycosyltransferase family 1 protein [Candidatus Woesebacteria bacterium]
MKIGVPLINSDPNYRGGSNSFTEGLLGGLVKEDRRNEYYILIYERNRSFYEKYISKRFHLVAFPNLDRQRQLFNSYLLLIFTAPFLRNFYYYIESILYTSLINKINQLNLDVIYSSSMPFFPMAVKGKLVISPHDVQHEHFPEYFTRIERWYRATVFPISFRIADVIQASSDFMKRDFHQAMKAPLKKIVVIPEGVMGVFLNFIPRKDLSEGFLKKYSLKPNYLFYPAQHWPHKNHITLLKAIKYLKEKYSMEVAAVFTGEKRPRSSYLYDFVKDNGLELNVKFVGNVSFSELFYAYYNSSIVVVPGEYESSSLPVREAMALGKPVIAARNGSNEEINLGNNMVLFSTYNYKELAENVRKLLKNKELCDNLVVKSRRIVKDYSWKKVARKYVDIFNKGLEL